MEYIKKIFDAVIPVLKYMVLSYLVIFAGYIFYIICGGNDAFSYVKNYATVLLVIFNIGYIVYLLKRNRFLCKKTKPIFSFIMLGIGYACFGNMVIMKFEVNQVTEINLFLLIISSVIVGPFVEEVIFRYILVSKLEKFNNRVFTILIASFIFAIMHSGFSTIIYTFILGIILNTVYIKNKNLLYPLIVHIFANLSSLFINGYNSYILVLSFVLLFISLLIVKKDYLLK